MGASLLPLWVEVEHRQFRRFATAQARSDQISSIARTDDVTGGRQIDPLSCFRLSTRNESSETLCGLDILGEGAHVNRTTFAAIHLLTIAERV